MGQGCFSILVAIIVIVGVILLREGMDFPDATIWLIILIVSVILVIPLLIIKLIKFIIEFIETL